ncbi:hypothetical protein [Streptomyces celluloflavus]
MTPQHSPGICMETAWRLSRQVLTMREAHLAAERLQQRGWKLGKVKTETISLTSGEWLAALAPGPIPDELRAKLAPHEGVLILTAMGKCARHP